MIHKVAFFSSCFKKNFAEITGYNGSPNGSPYHRESNVLSIFAKNTHKNPSPSFSEQAQTLNSQHHHARPPTTRNRVLSPHLANLAPYKDVPRKRTMSAAVADVKDLIHNENTLMPLKPTTVRVNADMTPNVKRSNSSRALFQTHNPKKDYAPQKTKIEAVTSNPGFKNFKLKPTPRHKEKQAHHSDSESSIDVKDIDTLIKNFK